MKPWSPFAKPSNVCVGVYEGTVASGVLVRHAHGSEYVSHDCQAERAFLGLESSPSFVRRPEGKGVSERFFRTRKDSYGGFGITMMKRT